MVPTSMVGIKNLVEKFSFNLLMFCVAFLFICAMQNTPPDE